MNPQARDKNGCSLAGQTLRSWGVLKLRATGLSMLPTLWPGDLLTIKSHELEHVQPGDIVLFMRRGRFFIHRVLSKRLINQTAILITRGDCMYKHDPPVRSGELLGKITEVRRGASTFLPGPRVSFLYKILAIVLCHWSLFRRAALRFWLGRHQGDSQFESTFVEATSYRRMGPPVLDPSHDSAKQ